MKKSDLAEGIVYVLMGAVCLLLEFLFWETSNKSLIGFAVFCLFRGIPKIREYVYWHSPENIERCREYTENEEIEAKDELRVKIRDKAGRYVYVGGLYGISAIVVVVGILGKLGIIADPSETVLWLGGYLLVQVIAERVVYNHIMKKY